MGSAILLLDHLPDPVGVTCLVGNDVGSGWKFIEQQLGHGSIVGLPGRQLDLHRHHFSQPLGILYEYATSVRRELIPLPCPSTFR
jgi:hypothetical protein